MRRHRFKSLRNFEILEDRRMMTGDISYNSSNHILTINGAGYDDVAQCGSKATVCTSTLLLRRVTATPTTATPTRRFPTSPKSFSTGSPAMIGSPFWSTN